MSKIFFSLFIVFVLNIKIREFRYVKIQIDQLAEKCINNLKFVKISDLIIYSEINYQNFESFENIKLDCFEKFLKPIEKINFIPKNSLSLDNSFNISLNSSFFFQTVYFQFAYIKNFEMCLSSFDTILDNNTDFNLYFAFSELKLKINNQIFKKIDGFCSIFKKINSIKFSNSCKYRQSTNPLIFQNSNINHLLIYGLVDSFVKKNLLGFNQAENNVNLKIKSLQLAFYRGSFTKKLLDRLIFKNVENIIIYGRLDSIDDDIFANFKIIKLVSLASIYGLKDGLKFLKSLNSELKLNSNSSQYIQNHTVKLFIMDYLYPEEDFCFFQDFPQNKLVLIESYSLFLPCSCLKFWLFDSYYHEYGIQIIKINNLCFNINEAELCDFESMKARCDKTSHFKKTSQDYYFEAQQFNYVILILTPFFSLFGIASNMVNIIASGIISKSSRNSKNKKFIWMKVNSLINLFYCLIFLFHVMSICVSINGIYCPKISRSFFMQYYEIFIVDFFGGILKTISNFLNIFISFERYNYLKNNGQAYFENKKKNSKYFISFINNNLFVNKFGKTIDRRCK